MSLHPKLEKFRNPKRTRTTPNQVTGEFETTILDDVQTTHDRIANFLEAESLRLGLADARRLRDKLAGTLAAMYEHTDSDLDRAEWAALVMVLSRRNAAMSETITRMCNGEGK